MWAERRKQKSNKENNNSTNELVYVGYVIQ